MRRAHALALGALLRTALHLGFRPQGLGSEIVERTLATFCEVLSSLLNPKPQTLDSKNSNGGGSC